MRSPYPVQPRPRTNGPANDPLSLVLGYQKIAETIQNLEGLIRKHSEEHIAQMKANKEEHDAKLAELDVHVKKVANHATNIQKGAPGYSPKEGVDFIVPTKAEIVKEVMGQIRVPKDGDTPIINEDSIAKKAAKLVKIPEQKAAEVTVPMPAAEDIVKEIREKGLLKVEDIKGFDTKISEIRNATAMGLAGKRYGHETMVRGGGSSSSSSSTGYQAPTAGSINGTNQIFTWATAPSVIVVDGGRAMQKVSSDGTVNWTGTTTTTLAVAPNFDVFASA